ncbi:glycosyltransferase [Lacunisphaera limnophila]|nr:glycosyltransferase [Lacunisphaera limnophila]
MRSVPVVWQWSHEKPYSGDSTILMRKRTAWEAPLAHVLKPSPIAVRVVAIDDVRKLAARIQDGSSPAARRIVVCDGLHGIDLAHALAGALNARLVYRSHNIEAHHRQIQIWLGSRFSPVNLLNALKFSRWDKWAREVADITAEICEEDIAWEKQWMAGKRVVVPPIIPKAGDIDKLSYQCDIAFVGSLDNAINVEGLRFLSAELMRNYPHLRLGVFGAASERSIAYWRSRLPDCLFIPNFNNFNDIIELAPVVVNPVLRSSGVNIKTYEALANGALVVATKAGQRGCKQARAIGQLFDLGSTDLNEIVARAKRDGIQGVRARRKRFQDTIAGPAEAAYLSLFNE